MDKIHRKALVQCRSRIVTDLSPENEFWDKVAEEEIFTPLMLEYIQATNPRPDKVRKLLDDLSRRGPEAFDKFLLCLDESGHNHLATYIREKERQLRNPGNVQILNRPTFPIQAAPAQATPAHPPPAQPAAHGDVHHSVSDVHLSSHAHVSDVHLSSHAQSSQLVSSQSSPSLSSTGGPITSPCDNNQGNTTQSGSLEVSLETFYSRSQNSAVPDAQVNNLSDCPGSQLVQVTSTGSPYSNQSQGRPKIYKMETNPRGLVLIINNINFHNNKHRPGSERDSDQLHDLFHNLGFNVDVRQNKTAFEMHEILQELSHQDNLHSVDSLIVVLMSHGTNEIIEGVDNMHLNVLDLVKIFNGEKCPAMRGKPKMFLINACRGGDTDCPIRMGKTLPVDLSEETERNLFRTQPANSDFVLAYSTFPGYVSFRDENDGSWFIQRFVEVFSHSAHEEHVMDLLTMVNNAVASMGESEEGSDLMIPAPMTTLRFKWYLNPPAS